LRALLDTCVISELRNPRGRRSVIDGVAEVASKDLYVSVISFGEIVKGVFLLIEGERKRELERWTHQLERHYADRILGIDLETVRIWGEKTAAAQMSGKVLQASDGLIAATALRHGLCVMTRNTADFEPAGVMLVNPWI